MNLFSFYSILRVKMVRSLSKDKQQDVLALFQKVCSLRKIAKTLHVCKSINV